MLLFSYLAALIGGSFFKSLLRFVLLPVLFVGFGYFGVSKIVKIFNQSTQFEQMQIKLNDANQALADKDEEYKSEIERLELDRIRLQEHHVEFERAAILENSNLKKVLQDNEKNKAWHNANIPDDIRRLREQSKTANAIPSELESSTSAN